MIILSVNDINLTYGTDVILDGVSFGVNGGDRIGVVGPNGAGKTTLLSIMAGVLEPTRGSVYRRSDYTIGYLRQKNHFFGGGTVIEEAERSIEQFRHMEEEIARLEHAITDSDRADFAADVIRYNDLLEEYKDKGGYTYKSELRSVLQSMGFGEETYSKRIHMLSGGERTRLALACLLLRKPDVLLLDEPTNHLDLRMLGWLDQYLKSYKGTIIVVSHDRYFLDRVVTGILDVRDTHAVSYRGNYTEYLDKRAERLMVMEREYEKQQKEIAKQEEIIRRFKGHNTEKLVKRAQSREKKLAAMEVLEKPKITNTKIRVSFDANYKSGNDVCQAEDISKSFGAQHLFSGVSYDIKKGERICIIGDNGVGKTTLLRIMIGQELPDSGYLRTGHNVNFGYYDQGQLLLNEDETVLGEMKNAYPLYTDTDMRSILGRFLFRGDDVFKEVRVLSGGEKAKLSLLKLMLSGANTLVLDEPTNHLDIESRETVEEALSEYEGTIIMVSHDRYLLERFPDRILELTGSGIREFKGKFDYYLEKTAERTAAASETVPARDAAVVPAATSEEERRSRKADEAAERRRTRELAELEARIDALEAGIEQTEADLCDTARLDDYKFLNRKSEELRQLKDELDEVYFRWIELQE